MLHDFLKLPARVVPVCLRVCNGAVKTQTAFVSRDALNTLTKGVSDCHSWPVSKSEASRGFDPERRSVMVPWAQQH